MALTWWEQIRRFCQNLEGAGSADTATLISRAFGKLNTAYSSSNVLIADPGGKYPTVHTAIGAAASGYSIIVMPGTYTGDAISIPDGVSICGSGQNCIFDFDVILQGNAQASGFSVADGHCVEQYGLKHYENGLVENILPLPLHQRVRKLEPVADYSMIYQALGTEQWTRVEGGPAGYSAAIRFYVNNRCRQLTAAFGNWASTGASITGLNPITIEAMLVDASTSRAWKLTFNGETSATIQPGRIVKSDALDIRDNAGLAYELVYYVSVTSVGMIIPGCCPSPLYSNGDMGDGYAGASEAVGMVIAAIPNAAAAGTGYAVNDLLTVVGGAGTGAIVKVATVNAGVPTSYTISAYGKDYEVVADLATTGGSGTGAKVDISEVNSYHGKFIQNKLDNASPTSVRAVTKMTSPALNTTYLKSIYGPIGIFGIPTSQVTSAQNRKPSIAVINDSIGAMEASIWGSPYPMIAKPLKDGKYPFVFLGSSGEAAVNFVADTNYSRIAMLETCDYAICQLGINDINDSQSAATVKTRLQAIWALCIERGLKVYQTTITPIVDSGGNYRTWSGQTFNAGKNAVRQEINAWIRAMSTGTEYLSGYIDIAAVVEGTGANLGKYKWSSDQGNTGTAWVGADGIHPSSAGLVVLQAPFVSSLADFE